ncbi:translocation/assembly module TamB domain-containing protein [Rhodospirillum sp. A1_3_36]|uniref:translocation/assembly module TamB domain-containing protein n=1 Tax=Rhodospirillum sp. A1_3_36 TaxID=3391666 RepID=UPI0039A56F12
MANDPQVLRPDPRDRAPSPRRKGRLVWRVLRWTGGILAAVLVTLLGLGAYLGRTDGGRAWVRATLEDLVTDPEGLSMRLGSLEGGLPGEVVLRDLTLSDPQGVWLRLAEAQLSWDPLALFGGRVRVESLTARGLDVVRAPVLPPGPEENAPSSSSPPDPGLLGLLTLKELAIREITLGAGLVGGTGAHLSVTGSLEPEGATAARAVLSVVRQDAPGHLDLGATLAGDPLALDLSLTAGEPQGGLLATLLDLPGAPAASLSLTGSGPLAGWTGTLDGGFDGIASLSGPLRLAVDGEGGTALGLDWALRVLDNAPPTLADVAGPETTLGLDLARSEAGDMTLSRLALAGPGWTGALSGTVAAAGDLDLTAKVDLDGPGPLARLAPELGLGGLSLTARGGGTLERPEAHLTLTGQGLSYAGDLRLTALNVTAAAMPTGDDIALSLEARPEGMELPAGGPALLALVGGAPVLVLSGTFEQEARRVVLDSLTLEGAGTRLAGTGALSLAENRVETAQVTLSLPDLSLLDGALGQSMAGGLKATVEAGDLGLSPLAGSVRLGVQGRGLSLGAEALDHLVGPEPSLEARATLSPDGSLGEGQLVLKAAGASVKGQGGLSADGTLDATLRAALADLGAVSPGLSGAPVLDVVASGPVSDPGVVVTLSADALGGVGPEVKDLRLHVTAGTLLTGAAGQVEGNAQVGGLPFTLVAPFTLDGAFSTLDLWDGRVALGSTRLDLGAHVDLATFLTEGKVSLKAPNLRDLGGLGAPPLSGSLSGSLTLTRRDGEQTAALDLTAPGLVLDGLDLGRLSLSGSVADALGAPGLDVSVVSTGGDVGAVQWSRLALGAKGGLADLGVRLDLDGQWDPGALTARTRARINLEAGPTIRLEALTAETGGKTLSLIHPATLSLAQGAEVDDLALDLDGGQMGLRGGLVNGAVKAKGSIAALPLSLVSLFVPDSDIAGALDAQIALSGSPDQPRATVAATLSDVRSDATIGHRALSAQMDATLSPKMLDATVTLGGFGANPARLTARLPMGPGPRIRSESPLEARMDWSGSVADLWEFSPLVEHRLAGQGVVDLRVSGTMDDPKVAGGLTVTDGSYENLVTGTVLKAIALRVQGDTGQRVSVDLKGTDGAAGRIAVDGEVTLEDLDRPVGAVSLKINDATLVRRDDALASLSADLALNLTDEGARLGGQVTTKVVDIRLVGGLGPSVSDLAVIEVGGTGEPATVQEALAARKKALAEAPPPLPIDLDLRVSMPNRVYVKGAGVDSEWKGNLTVSGRANQPKVVGQVTGLYANATFLGRSFSLRRGEIRFDGGRRIDPQLDVTVENDAGDVVALVNVSGSASNPELSFSSEPALPEDEVISQILFGKTSGELTAFEAVQLAQVAGELAGFGGGRGFIEKLKDFTGLDVLQLGEGASGGTTLEAGTHLRENVYVGVEQGLGLKDSAVEVQVELTPEITVETKAGVTGTGEAGIFWKKDY